MSVRWHTLISGAGAGRCYKRQSTLDGDTGPMTTRDDYSARKREKAIRDERYLLDADRRQSKAATTSDGRLPLLVRRSPSVRSSYIAVTPSTPTSWTYLCCPKSATRHEPRRITR